MKIDYTAVGEKIRDARLNARITQEVLAEKTDLSITTSVRLKMQVQASVCRH